MGRTYAVCKCGCWRWHDRIAEDSEKRCTRCGKNWSNEELSKAKAARRRPQSRGRSSDSRSRGWTSSGHGRWENEQESTLQLLQRLREQASREGILDKIKENASK